MFNHPHLHKVAPNSLLLATSRPPLLSYRCQIHHRRPPPYRLHHRPPLYLLLLRRPMSLPPPLSAPDVPASSSCGAFCSASSSSCQICSPTPQGAAEGLPTPQGAAEGSPIPQGAVKGSPTPQGAVKGLPTPQGAVEGSPTPEGAIEGSPTPQGAATPDVDPVISDHALKRRKEEVTEKSGGITGNMNVQNQKYATLQLLRKMLDDTRREHFVLGDQIAKYEMDIQTILAETEMTPKVTSILKKYENSWKMMKVANPISSGEGCQTMNIKRN